MTERFGLADREAARDDVAGDPQLRLLVGEREQRARVAHRQRVRRDAGANLLRQPEQPHEVGDRRAVLADRVGDLFLGQVEFIRRGGDTRSPLRSD